MSQAFLGEIKLVGWNFAARGYAFCNAQIMSIAQNTALFSLLGTTYGGNGQTTFSLPDLRGKVAVSQGQSPGFSDYVIGQVGGVENTSLTINNMPMHNHIAATTVTPTFTAPTVAVMMNGVNRPSARQAAPGGAMLTGAVDSVSGNAINGYALASSGTSVTMAPESCTTTVTGGGVTATAATTVQPAGGSLPFGILQPYLALNYIIALEGIFPSRN